MWETQLSFAELALVGGTRAAAGAGLGLLLADRFAPEQRRAIGWTLLLIGAITTIPLALEVLSHRLPRSEERREQQTSARPPEGVDGLGQRRERAFA
jgi:hypothetical protein